MPQIDSLAHDQNTIRILLTTDNHVGYLENDPVRGNDSWRTFQEITYLAKQYDVDMLLQGGDLFHVSKPSKKSLFHVVQSLRHNCLGDRPCELELLSDPAPALRTGDVINYEDPNLNVSVPVFAISGNHDDSTGEGLLSPMDVLAATGLVNYFGQVPQSDKITVTPLVFQKGTSKLALYGINNMRDERLQRIMRNGDVTFQKPKADAEFFNLLCVHQNHFRHSMTSYVPEDFFPTFLDFVMWGHEHECIPFPQYNPTTGFDTLQPGSSVATSLSEGETAKKHVFLLDIRGKDYAITPIPLSTVRPFVMRDVSLRDEGFIEGPASKADVQAFLYQQVEDLIEEALQTEHASQSEPLLPLIRLRVDHTGDYEIENSRRFSNKFVGKIANVNDILLYHKKRTLMNKESLKSTAPRDTRETEPSSNSSIQHILKDCLGESSLYLIPEDGIFGVTKKFIEQDDKSLLTDYVKKTLTSATESLQNINIDEEEFHLGDEDTVKRSFRQLLNKLRTETKRKPVTQLSSLDQESTNAAKSSTMHASTDDQTSLKSKAKSGPPKTRASRGKYKSPERVQIENGEDSEGDTALELNRDASFVHTDKAIDSDSSQSEGDNNQNRSRTPKTVRGTRRNTSGKVTKSSTKKVPAKGNSNRAQDMNDLFDLG